jgi:3-deoxy-D-manno-octulosonic-acid transferase
VSAFVNIYSVLLDVVRVVLLPLLRGADERNGWDLALRQKLPSPVRDFRDRRVVWLHASSLGEAKLLVKFASMLRERHADDLYLVTATTRGGVAYLEKNRHPSFCAIGFQPIDTLTLVRRIVGHYGVKRLWLVETELWPSLLHVCAERRLPVGIVNGRIEARTFARYRSLRFLVAPLLAPVDIVLAQSDEYAARFIDLGIGKEKVHVVGNIKGHIRIERPRKQEWLQVRRALNLDEQAFVVTAGCMHKGEGAVLRAFFSQMERRGYPCRLIVVPRYCHEAAGLLDEIGGSVLHVREPATARRWEICLIEATGVLDDLYKIADAAIVGGTFVDIGGHNLWDAARFGIPVFFGTDYHTQQESGDLLLQAGVGFAAADGVELADRMFSVVKEQPARFPEAQARFIEATNKSGSIVEPLLP